MYNALFISSLLVALGAALSFVKDLLSVKKEANRTWRSYVIPAIALILGLTGLASSVNNSVDDIKSKAKSDTALVVQKQVNDSLTNRIITLLGGGNIEPRFIFTHLSQDVITFMIMDSSKFPVRDISVNILDNVALAAYKTGLNNSIKDSGVRAAIQLSSMLNGNPQYEQSTSIPYLTFQNLRTLQTVTIPKEKLFFDYKVNIDWTTGGITYYIKGFRINPGGWSERITRYDHQTGATTLE